MPEAVKSNHLFTLGFAALGGVAAATAAGFGGRWAWGLELFTHFRVQYLLAAAVLGLVFVLCGRRRAALLAAVLVAANGAALTPLFFPPAQAAAGGNKHAARELRVLSLNVYAGNTEIERVLRYVQREKPDVVVLLEITDQWAAPLEALARRYPFRWIRPGDVYSGMAVLSREVPEQTRLIALGSGAVTSLLMTFSGPADSRLSILGTHLSVPLGRAASGLRNRQLASLAQIARAHPWPLLIVGDLNITPFSPLFVRLLREGRLENCARNGWHPTWPAGFAPLLIQIDHCLATAALPTRDFRVGPDVGSDHYPIAVKAGFAKP